LEFLEDRALPSAGAREEYALELINRMRTNPAAELPLLLNSTDPNVQQSLSYFNVDQQVLAQQWATLQPVAPLAWNDNLAAAAVGHNQLMIQFDQQSHQLPGEPDLYTRFAAAGWDVGGGAYQVGENVFAFAQSVFDAHAAFAIDWANNPPTGIHDPPGHRENIMNAQFREVGIGVTDAPAGLTVGPLVTTQDYGYRANLGNAFVVGALYQDTNNNGSYDEGEGIAGVTIVATGPSGTFTTTTSPTGGYQLPLPAGTYTVTASGGGLANPIKQTVTVGADNVSLDIKNTGGTVVPAPVHRVAVGAGAGGGPQVNVYDPVTGDLKFSFMAYDPNFTGGVRVAVGDVNGDGTPDIVTAPGPGGGPDIRVFDGKTGALTREFMAYDPGFTGGVFVALGDVNGDGHADIITGADAGGGPNVRVFSGTDNSLLYDFFAYDMQFHGGVRVAAGDLTGTSKADIITGAGPGGGPQVNIYDGGTGQLLRSYMAYDSSFGGGVYVATGDVNGNGHAEIITGAGPGGGPQVNTYDGATDKQLSGFMAYDSNFHGGANVTKAFSGYGYADIVTGAGPGGGPQVNFYDGQSGALVRAFFPFDPAFVGGVYVGGQ
jgi:uncharacterized protein YkwD